MKKITLILLLFIAAPGIAQETGMEESEVKEDTIIQEELITGTDGL